MLQKSEIEAASQVHVVARDLLKKASEIEVTTEPEAEVATDMIKVIDAQLKRADAARTSLVKPLNDHVKYINASFKEATAPLEEARRFVRGELAEYVREKARREREEQEARQRAAAAALLEAAEKAELDGNSAGAEAALAVAVSVEGLQAKGATVVGCGASASTRKVYKVRVTGLDIYEMKRFLTISEVPATYSLTSRSAPVPLVSLNLQEIHAAFAAGEKLPKGIEVLVEDELVVR